MPERRPPDATSLPLAPSDDARRIAIEEWFLRRGMPSVARSSSGLRRLLPRAASVFIAYGVADLAVTLSDAALRELDREAYDTFLAPGTMVPEWYLIAVTAGAVLAVLAGILVNLFVRRLPPGAPAARAIGIGAPVSMFLLPLLDRALGLDESLPEGLVGGAIVFGATLLLIRAGLGAIFVWALRQALAQGSALSPMAARALPMIVLVTLFAFLSEGLWRVSGALSRNELWLVVTILLGIAALFIWTVIRGEMRQLIDDPHCSPAEMRAAGFPVDVASIDIARPEPLTKREAANARFILFVAQALQVGTLVILVFVFFCVFGAITVPASVIEVWTGHAPTTGTLLGVQLPVRHELIQTSLFLAAFSAVSFAASSVTDPMYRQNFFEPILRDMRVTIAARNLYRASLPDTAAEPSPTPTSDPRHQPTVSP